MERLEKINSQWWLSSLFTIAMESDVVGCNWLYKQPMVMHLSGKNVFCVVFFFLMFSFNGFDIRTHIQWKYTHLSWWYRTFLHILRKKNSCIFLNLEFPFNYFLVTLCPINAIGLGFPGSSDGKESVGNAGDQG